MKAICLLITFMATTAVVGECTEADSTRVRILDEVTIEAVAQRTEPDRTVYIPDGRQRRSATDGLSLLARMNIPQLDVNPLAGSVKTADNQDVSLFINYKTASREDVAGLDPRSVRRVEYFDFPTDPRFQRVAHAVNFITRRMEYGGYTKMSGKERFLIDNGDASLYSKFSYKAMEYDVMVNGDYDAASMRGERSEEIYRLPAATIGRTSTTLGGRHREYNLFAGLRASWSKGDSFNLRNLIEFRQENTTANDSHGEVTFTPAVAAVEEYNATGSSRFRNVAWVSDIYSALGNGWSLAATLQARYDDNRTSTGYFTHSTSLCNGARESGWTFRGDLQVNKSLGDRLSLFGSLLAGAGRTVIDYTGSSEARNIFTPAFTGASAGVALSAGNLSGSVDGGFAFESSTINGSRVIDSYPFTHINLQYSPGEKSTCGLWFQYAAFSPDASMKNPNMIRQNELLYVAGNPDLHASRHISANISYTFLPDNRWQLTAYATMFRIMSRQAPVYIPDGPDGLMVKRYLNDGDYNHGQIGASVIRKFFGGRLSASLSPRLLLYYTTGANSEARYPLCAVARVDYYAGAFFFNLYWGSGSRYVDGETCYLRRLPSEYMLSAGWAARGWNLQLSLVNIFRSSWATSRDSLHSEWYDSRVVRYGSDYHRRISLTVAYTISYGRKITRDNELSGDGHGSTAILK